MNDLKLGNVIKREMKSRSMSIADLSEAVGIPSSSLHNWIQGTRISGKNLSSIKTLSDFFRYSNA